MLELASPLVSVLVPAYNAEATLGATLRSALASTYSNFEIIVVEDGSTDRTAAIAEEFAREDSRVRLFRQDHRGVSAALNHGLAEARGDYVARLDADDLWHPAKLRKQVDAIEANPAATLVYCLVRYVDDHGRVTGDAASPGLSGHALSACLYSGIPGGGSCVLFRKSAMDRAGGYDERLVVWEDLLMHMRVAALGEITFVPEYLAAYRSRADSSSSDPHGALRDWRTAKRQIANAFPQIPRFVITWSNARRQLELAEAFAARRHFATAAKLVAQSLASDFTQAVAFLASLVRRRPDRTLPFAELAADSPSGQIGGNLAPPALERLDASRSRLLQSVDRDIALASQVE